MKRSTAVVLVVAWLIAEIWPCPLWAQGSQADQEQIVGFVLALILGKRATPSPNANPIQEKQQKVVQPQTVTKKTKTGFLGNEPLRADQSPIKASQENVGQIPPGKKQNEKAPPAISAHLIEPKMPLPASGAEGEPRSPIKGQPGHQVTQVDQFLDAH